MASRKLYADENGQKTGEDLLKEQELENEEGSNAKKYPAIFLEPAPIGRRGTMSETRQRRFSPNSTAASPLRRPGENVYAISRAYDIDLDNQEKLENEIFRPFAYGRDY